jgi:hypothetical protein
MEEPEDDNETSFSKRFGWYVVLNRVASDDITKHETILSKPLVEVLNQTNFIIQKDMEIENERKKMMSKFS